MDVRFVHYPMYHTYIYIVSSLLISFFYTRRPVEELMLSP